jgi:hypothetical protein
MTYNPELYWTRVGQEIEKRSNENLVAGDDNPLLSLQANEISKALPRLNRLSLQRWDLALAGTFATSRSITSRDYC